MRLMLATLCLNEMQWLPKLWQQHRDWPGLVNWTFVEAADPIFTASNPTLVKDGLSVDGTSEFIKQLTGEDERVVGIHRVVTAPPNVHRCPPGQQGAVPSDQHKCAMRQAYLDAAEQIKPDFLMVLDADEFYPRQCQAQITELLTHAGRQRHAFCFKQRHLWRPPSYSEVITCPACEGKRFWVEGGCCGDCVRCDGKGSITPTLPTFPSEEVVGGYWNVPHVRGWRWQPGVRYIRNHNWLEDRRGNFLNHQGHGLTRFDQLHPEITCCHLGYASSGIMRRAKHRYYVARGEGSEANRRDCRTRSMYVRCRQAWEDWQPGQELPDGAKLRSYDGLVPECFQ